jgi:hypothetical protein
MIATGMDSSFSAPALVDCATTPDAPTATVTQQHRSTPTTPSAPEQSSHLHSATPLKRPRSRGRRQITLTLNDKPEDRKRNIKITRRKHHLVVNRVARHASYWSPPAIFRFYNAVIVSVNHKAVTKRNIKEALDSVKTRQVTIQLVEGN